jgi:hypothetical protein
MLKNSPASTGMLSSGSSIRLIIMFTTSLNGTGLHCIDSSNEAEQILPREINNEEKINYSSMIGKNQNVFLSFLLTISVDIGVTNVRSSHVYFGWFLRKCVRHSNFQFQTTLSERLRLRVDQSDNFDPYLL